MSIDWLRAACQDYDRDLFFSDNTDDIAFAVGVCASCDIQLECRQWALMRREQYGVWGGLTEKERRALTIVRKRAKCPGCASYEITKLGVDGRHQLCNACGLSWKI
jgi:WhiB family transcriptional regulator, redox-sensing transcriptional regulator